MTVEEAKLAFMEEAPAGEPHTLREWIEQNPGRAIAIAAGAGLTLAIFPRLRRVALPLAITVIQRAVL